MLGDQPVVDQADAVIWGRDRRGIRRRRVPVPVVAAAFQVMIRHGRAVVARVGLLVRVRQLTVQPLIMGRGRWLLLELVLVLTLVLPGIVRWRGVQVVGRDRARIPLCGQGVRRRRDGCGTTVIVLL